MIKGSMKIITVAMLIAGMGMPAWAGTIRHDRSDTLYTDLSNESQFDAVGEFIYNGTGGSFRASGTLICSGPGESWVLTAGHVVDDTNTSFMNFTDSLGRTHSAADWFAFNTWSGDLTAGNDIALVRFDTEITDIDVAKLYDDTDILGRVGTSVGYGRTGNGQTGDTQGSGTRRAGQNILDTSGIPFGYSGNTIMADFDNPLDASDNVIGSATPLNLEYSIAPGDSGGGQFIEVDGEWFLVGVHSFGASGDGSTNSDYGDVFGSTWVLNYMPWIESHTGPLDAKVIPAPLAVVLIPGLLAVMGLRRR